VRAPCHRGTLVQLLPPSTPLVEDAFASAVRTGRLKDKLRVKQFLESPTIDLRAFSALIERFGLTA
jgi:hypothetical protein